MAEKIYPDVSYTRHNNIIAISNELKNKCESVNKTYKKYSKASSGVEHASMVLNTLGTVQGVAGVATSLSVAGLPVGTILMGTDAACGALGTLLIPIGKHLNKKKLKHGNKLAKYRTTKLLLELDLSKMLDDGVITHTEYERLIEVYKKHLISVGERESGEYISAEVKKRLAQLAE